MQTTHQTPYLIFSISEIFSIMAYSIQETREFLADQLLDYLEGAESVA